jgi:Kef-type K+ transport system membrane component KefB
VVGFNIGSFLIQFLLIVGGAALFRRLARYVNQPPLLGEMLLGILLGPSLLAWAWPDAYQLFFPSENRPLLEALAWIGLILFIWSVGAELHWSKTQAWPIFFVAMGGLVVPFVLGSVMALATPEWFFVGEPRFESMILVGIIMSVSALPILGRLLREAGLLASPGGVIAMGAATIDDIVAWTLLGLVAGGASIGLLGDVNLNLLLIAALFGGGLLLDRYLTPHLSRQARKNAPALFVLLLITIFAAALLTHEAGLHALLGAFAVGAVLSRHPVIRDYARTRMDEIVLVLFLPSFFVLAGMDIDLTILDYPNGILALLATVIVATVAKLLGAYIGARAVGVEPRIALQTGVLINARGAVGLVVAKVGLDQGLLSQAGFTIMALMIAITTIIAPLGLGLIRKGGRVPTVEPGTEGTLPSPAPA